MDLTRISNKEVLVDNRFCKRAKSKPNQLELIKSILNITSRIEILNLNLKSSYRLAVNIFAHF